MRLTQFPLPFAVFALSMILAAESAAFSTLVLEADEISAPGVRVSKAIVSVDLTAATGPLVRAHAARVRLDEPLGSYRSFVLTCPVLIVSEPHFGCGRASIAAEGGPAGSIELRAAAEFNSDTKRLSFDGTDLRVAGGSVRFSGALERSRWSLDGRAEALSLAELRTLAAPWLTIPQSYTVAGRVDAQVEAAGRSSRMRLGLVLRSADLSFSNEEGSTVAENVALTVNADAHRSHAGTALEVRLASPAGQALAGPVFLDFAANPLELEARGALAGERLRIDALSVRQRSLLAARAEGELALERDPVLTRARVELEQLEFPAAYRSLLQLALATTDFGALQTRGRASGSLEIAANRPARLELRFEDVNVRDAREKFSMSNARGEIHWADAEETHVEPSFLSWSSGSAYGLSGSAARIDFLARGRGLELTRGARVPVFDGAIVLRALAARDLGKPQARLNFDAVIEPISMPLLSRAFGWPELQGQLAGRIPGIAYRDRELTVDGDLVASVFDGTIVGRHFRLRDPLGPWPRLFADVTARGLDLELVTRAFSIGTITGRLDADLEALELFNWSPVAFDARLYSTPGDRSRHLISQKAVTRISSIGGGGGAVTRTLQSGVLRFFDDFRYDRIGITCRLRADVCLMGGIEPAGHGYYIVKGKGLPRIDIIGNQGRVDWPQLVAQIVAGMRSEEVIVR